MTEFKKYRRTQVAESAARWVSTNLAPDLKAAVASAHFHASLTKTA